MAPLKNISLLFQLIYIASKCIDSAPSDAKDEVPDLQSEPTAYLPITDPFLFDANWSSNFLSIVTTIDITEGTVNTDDLSNDCSTILDDKSLSLIGAESSCIWTKIKQKTLELTIHLSSTATIDLQDTLTIWNHPIASINIPSKLSPPKIKISSKPSKIGVCDGLILDACSTTNLGGREGVFIWIITNTNDIMDTMTYSGSYIEIENTLLRSETSYNIVLTVTNWYQQSSDTQYTVYKSENIIPVVSLHGITQYSPTNVNLNGNIQIYSDITLHDDCTGETKPEEADQYIDHIQWSVDIQKIYENDPVSVDESIFKALQKRLEAFDDMDSITISASSYLQSGFVYQFIMNVQCVKQYKCDIDSVHSVVYDYTDIECGIFGGDIILDDVDPDSLSNLELNGLVLTYDPDKENNDALQWSWDCINTDNDVSCVDVLDHDDASIINMNLNGLSVDYSSSYSYLMTMKVSDGSNMNRNDCFQSVFVNINTADEDTVGDGINTIYVTATAISSIINRNDPLRVITDITDDEEDDVIYEYQWQEMNGLLSDDMLAQQINLILDPDVLNEDETYVFQLKVTVKSTADDTVIGYGESNAVSVYVNQSPVITRDSFDVAPTCTDEYESISELLSTSHFVSISADSDYQPLLYQFGVKINENERYFHDSLLSEASLNGVYLPVMDSFILFSNVYDAEGSIVSTEMECSITLNSYSECIDFKTSLNMDDLISQSAQNSYILRQSQVYVQYLDEYYDGEDTDCVEQQISHILDMIHERFTSDLITVCDEHKVIELTQSMISLLSLMDDTQMYNEDIFDKVQDLLFIVLDPCSYITTEIQDLKDLSVSDVSIITQIPRIHHNNNDITQHLSPIIQPKYQHLLFEITSWIITLIHSVSYSNSMPLYDLLSSSIYIAQMMDISTSISGESDYQSFDSFSIYSERVIPGESVDVEIQNVMVHIPNDITVSSTEDLLFDGVDVLISGVEISNTDRNVAVNIDDGIFDGILVGNVLIDITLLSDTVDSSNLPSDIEFTLDCNDSCDESMNCAWYNADDNMWSNDGCFTSINDIEEEITCSCSHLTTFAVIYNMHQTESEADVFVDDTSSELERYLHWVLSAAFLMISIYVIFQIYPFFINKELDWKHRAVFVMLMVGITSFLYFLICLEYLVSSSVSIKLMTLLLLLPHISYLLIFSMLFYTWFTLAHSFNPNIQNMRRTLQYYLCGLNITISCLLLIYFILILCNIGGDQLFKIASFIWSALTTVITIIISIYAIISAKVLYETTTKSASKQAFAAKDWKVVRRLVTINSCITLYFIFESCITMYYSIHIDNKKNIMSHKLLELFVNVFCLMCICWMYRQSMKRLIKSNLYDAQRRKHDVAQRRKTQTQTNIDLPSNATYACTTPPQSTTLPNTASPEFLTVNSFSKSKSPPSSRRTSQFSNNGLPPIVEMDAEPESIRVDTDIEESITVDVIPQISIRSREIDVSLIIEDMGSQLNAIHSAAAPDPQMNENNKNDMDPDDNDIDETETAMYNMYNINK